MLKNDELWLGYCNIKQFRQPDGSMAKFGNKLWFTNLDIPKRHEPLILYKHYIPEEYPTYDNYDAINVDKVVYIPCDYFEVIGVPISFLDKFCPDQFEIVGGSIYDDTPCRIKRNYREMGYKFLKTDGHTESGSGALRDKTSPKVKIKGKSDYSISPEGDYLSACYARIFVKYTNSWVVSHPQDFGGKA